MDNYNFLNISKIALRQWQSLVAACITFLKFSINLISLLVMLIPEFPLRQTNKGLPNLMFSNRCFFTLTYQLQNRIGGGFVIEWIVSQLLRLSFTCCM